MNDSIFTTIKSLLDIHDDDDSFDADILTFINTAFYSLRQIGVGPRNGFVIDGPDQTWSDFSEDQSLISEVKTYIQQKVRLLFDPPNNSFLVSAIQDNIKELEFRLNIDGEGAFNTEQEADHE